MNIIKYILTIIILIIQLIGSLVSLYIFRQTMYMLLKLYGMDKLLVRDYRKFKHDSKIIVFQHTSFADAQILIYLFKNVKFLLKSKYTSFKYLAIIAKNLGFIITKPKNTTEDILKYIESEAQEYLGIAPMGGTTTYTDRIGTFSSGAFVAMQPVTPVLIDYNNDGVTWYQKNKEKYGFMDSLYRIASLDKWDAAVIILEEVTAEGCSTPREFADKVRNIMAESYNLHCK